VLAQKWSVLEKRAKGRKPRNRYTQKKIQFYSTDAGGVALQQRWCVSTKQQGITSQMTVEVTQSHYRPGKAQRVPGC